MERESFENEKVWTPGYSLEEILKVHHTRNVSSIGEIMKDIAYHSGDAHGNHGPRHMPREHYIAVAIIKQARAEIERNTEAMAGSPVSSTSNVPLGLLGILSDK